MVADSVRAFEDMAVRFLMPLTLHHSFSTTPTITSAPSTKTATSTAHFSEENSYSNNKPIGRKGSSPLEGISTHIRLLGRNKADLFNTTNNVAIFIHAMLAIHEIKQILLHITNKNNTQITRPQRNIPHNSDPSKLTMSQKTANLSVLARNQVNFPHIVIIQ